MPEGSGDSPSTPGASKQQVPGSTCSMTDGEGAEHNSEGNEGQFRGFSSFADWLEAVKETGFKSGVLFSEDMYAQALEVLSVAPVPDTRATNQPGSSRFRHSIRSEKKWFLRRDGEGKSMIMGPGNRKGKDGEKGEDRTVLAVGSIERELHKMHVDGRGRHLRKGPLDRAVRDKFIGISRLACEAFCYFCPVCSGRVGASEDTRRSKQEPHTAGPKADSGQGHEAGGGQREPEGRAAAPDGGGSKRQRSPGATQGHAGGRDEPSGEGSAKRSHGDGGAGGAAGVASGRPPRPGCVTGGAGLGVTGGAGLGMTGGAGLGDAARGAMARGFEEAAGLEKKLHALWKEHSSKRQSVRETEDSAGVVAHEEGHLRSAFQSYPALCEQALRLRRQGATRDCVKLLEALSAYLETGKLEAFQGTQIARPTQGYVLEID